MSAKEYVHLCLLRYLEARLEEVFFRGDEGLTRSGVGSLFPCVMYWYTYERICVWVTIRPV